MWMGFFQSVSSDSALLRSRPTCYQDITTGIRTVTTLEASIVQAKS